VIGSTSLLNEVELIQIIDEVFAKLGVGVTVKINNRKILSGIAEVIGEEDKIIDITVAIDKLDKIGVDKVIEELKAKGLNDSSLEKVTWLIGLQKENDKIAALEKFLSLSSVGLKGIEEVKEVSSFITRLTSNSSLLEFDLTLARGLNYYTGSIIEVKVNDPRSTFTSSICGGGRYDDLTGIFGLPNVSGVGISFGVDRIYDVMDEMKLFDELKLSGATTKIIFVNFGNEEEKYCLGLLKQIRNAGINGEIYPDASKMKKQMGYADDNKIPFVCLVGSDEIKSGQLTLKDMTSGEQEKISIEGLISKLQQ
jgi:histidyl-tRNA synthetase